MITAVVKYETEDYVRALRFMQGRWPRLFYLLIWAGMMFFAILSYLRASDSSGWDGLPFLVISLAAVLCGVMIVASLFAFRFLERFRIKRQLNSSRVAEGSYSYIFDEQGFSIGGELSQSELKWAAVIKAVETEKDFYFYTSKKFAHFIPKRAFASTSDIDQVRKLTVSVL